MRATLSLACLAGASLASAIRLADVPVRPMTAAGRATAGSAVPLSSLVGERGAVIFAVRRPG